MKIPKARKLKSGKWFIQLRFNGQSVSVTRDTKADCEYSAAQIKASYILNNEVPSKDMTLTKGIDRYISRRENILSPSTIAGYRAIQRNYFKNVMNEKMSKIDWQSEINRESMNYSAKTIKNAYGLIRAVYKDIEMSFPSVRLPQVIKHETPFLDAEQIKVFLSAVNGKRCELPALLALHSLRSSEIYGLTENDITDTIRVNKSKVCGQIKNTNKNESSNRVIPVMIPRVKELPFDFPEPKTAREEINKICRENNLPEVGLHGLRHSFCSLAFYLGFSAKEVMAVGGWSDDKTMNKIYHHVYENALTESQNRMANFFQNANGNANGF